MIYMMIMLIIWSSYDHLFFFIMFHPPLIFTTTPSFISLNAITCIWVRLNKKSKSKSKAESTSAVVSDINMVKSKWFFCDAFHCNNKSQKTIYEIKKPTLKAMGRVLFDLQWLGRAEQRILGAPASAQGKSNGWSKNRNRHVVKYKGYIKLDKTSETSFPNLSWPILQDVRQGSHSLVSQPTTWK